MSYSNNPVVARGQRLAKAKKILLEEQETYNKRLENWKIQYDEWNMIARPIIEENEQRAKSYITEPLPVTRQPERPRDLIKINTINRIIDEFDLSLRKAQEYYDVCLHRIERDKIKPKQ